MLLWLIASCVAVVGVSGQANNGSWVPFQDVLLTGANDVEAFSIDNKFFFAFAQGVLCLVAR